MKFGFAALAIAGMMFTQAAHASTLSGGPTSIAAARSASTVMPGLELANFASGYRNYSRCVMGKFADLWVNHGAGTMAYYVVISPLTVLPGAVCIFEN